MQEAPSGASLASGISGAGSELSQLHNGALSSQNGPTAMHGLPDELARRLVLAEQLPAGVCSSRAETPDLPPLMPRAPPEAGSSTVLAGVDICYFCEARHDEQASTSYDVAEEGVRREGLVSKWRQKERLKTTAVALVVCLNIGVDPPDVIKISPCARLECWVDPLSMQAPKALDTIGKNLQAQYERWQPRAKYRMHLDPTTEDVKKLVISCRRTAKNERVLFHYNGHGVPRPTANGEIWVFNKSYTQYIPLSIYDLQTWVGTPAIYVFDCSAAGQILNSFRQFMFQRQQELEGYAPTYPPQQQALPYGGSAGGGMASAQPDLRPDPMRECILLCACGEGDLLPQNPDLPADVFTSCLTTPIKVALRWFVSRSLLRHEGVTKELIDRIPGKQTDRKTPLGELNWIFTAITDTIAWNVLPRALFQKLFRQDLLVASLFRNFLLAERVLRAANCTPVSYPRLPPTHQHPMWQAWDMAAEMCLLQLPDLLSPEGASHEYQPSPFFSEQLTAFELWLEHGSQDKRPPEQLPIVLQVLLSQVHRLRALVLLGRFLDMGAWAVDLALSVGIFPYVLKLLQTTAPDLRQTLVFIWAKILAWDANAQVQGDLVKDGGHLYFIKHLEARDAAVPAESRAQAAFVLAAICDKHPKGQLLCAQAGLLQVCSGQLPAVLAALASAQDASRRQRERPSEPGCLAAGGAALKGMSLLVKWLLLTVGKLCEDLAEVAAMALREQVQDTVAKLLAADSAEIRAAAVFSLGALILTQPPSEAAGGEAAPLMPEAERVAIERAIACAILEVVYDASPLVRAEAATALARLAVGHSLLFHDAVHAHQRTSARILREAAAALQAASSAPAGAGARGTPSSAAANSSGTALALTRTGSGGPLPRGGSSSNLPAAAASAGAAASADGTGASPGVRLRDDLSYEPMLHVGLDASLDLGGIYASADAARVGGGLYLAVVEALCTLATDPSPRVAVTGRAALKAANVELVAVGTSLGGQAAGLSVAAASSSAGSRAGSAPSSPRASMSSAQSLPPPPINLSSSMAGGASSLGSAVSGGVSSLIPKSWQPKNWRSNQLIPRSGAALGRQPSTPGSPAASPNGGSSMGSGGKTSSGSGEASCSRPAFVLRRVPDAGDGAASALSPRSLQSAQSTASMEVPSRAASAASMAADTSRAASAAALPPSPVYRLSCRYFSWPLLVPQAVEEAAPSYAYWTRAPNSNKVAARRQKRREDLARSMLAGSPDRSVKLKEQVVSVETGAQRSVAIALDPVRPLLMAADGEGVVRICSYGGQHPSTLVNRFNLAGDSESTRQTPVAVAALFQLNELHNSLLLACSADGAVRAFRNHTMRGGQRLATAFQSVLVAGTGALCRPTVYEWSAEWGALFSCGGRASDRIYMWDLERESCALQLSLPTGASSDLAAASSSGQPSAATTHLASSHTAPLLFAADATGTVRIFDLRAGGGPVGSTQHQRGRLAGLAVEPGATPHLLVLGYPSAQLAFLDCRMLPADSLTADTSGQQQRLEVGVWKSFDAHSKGPMTALAAHRYAPLIATATASQVVKVWNARGEQLGVVRAHTSFLAQQRIGPAKQLAFSPYDLRLASGGDDSVVAVYSLDVGPASTVPSPQRPSAVVPLAQTRSSQL